LEPSATQVFSAVAEYNSAIQQIENLRYVKETAPEPILVSRGCGQLPRKCLNAPQLRPAQVYSRTGRLQNPQPIPNIMHRP
jgi:hypothetical protein